ncbi:MAG: hypothetical protein Q7T81_17720 [Pseudolabrys sp.]|nr:hypothetical protein [Pseudolabrys sp.]
MMKPNKVLTAALLAAAAFVLPAHGQTAPKAAAQAAPYKPVTITLPVDMADATFTTLRNQLAEAARKRDAQAVARLVVGGGFFWERDRTDAASKRRSGYENLAAALGLSSKDSVGWDMLMGFADDSSASASPRHKGAVCAPAEPGYDVAAFDKMLKATATSAGDWGYAVKNNIDVRTAPGNSTPVIDKLGLQFVRVLPEAKAVSPVFQRIVTPAGKTGYVSIDVIAPFGGDQICYVKDASGWKVGGYIGAGEPQ